MAGMEQIKLNSPACCLFTPQKSEPAIVEPLLEMPGKVPMPWAKPIRSACHHEGAFSEGGRLFSSTLLSFEEDLALDFLAWIFSIKLERIKRMAVIIKPMQT